MATATTSTMKRTNSRASKGTKNAASAEKMNQVVAAELVLASAGEPINCRVMVEVMATNGYWSSPGGQTPHLTRPRPRARVAASRHNAVSDHPQSLRAAGERSLARH